MSKKGKREWFDRVNSRPGYLAHLLVHLRRLDSRLARYQPNVSNERVRQGLRVMRKLRNAGIYSWDPREDEIIREWVARLQEARAAAL